MTKDKRRALKVFVKKGPHAFMVYHTFSLDPRIVLGVSPTATLDEVDEAYRAKSKKHHPDLGGDEWAFHMVTRAYEVLKATNNSTVSRPWMGRGQDIGAEPKPG
jgi:hypothetical protein